MNDRGLVSVLIAASLVALFAACLLGSTPMGPGAVMGGLLGTGTEAETIVIREIRLPRALASFIVGAALGVSGAALQGLLRNPLAEPGVLGVSATASLFASFSIFYGFASMSAIVVPLAAVLGGLAATLVIVSIAMVRSGTVTLILVGVGLSSFAGALLALLLNLAPNPFTLADLLDWSLGSVANISMPDIRLVLPFIFLGMVALWLARRELSLLSLGEEAAHGAGVDLQKVRFKIIGGTGLAVGAATALAGAIGFVGIVAPHLIRPFVAYDPARTLAPSALLGGIMLVLADCAARLLPTPAELKLGVLAALVGAPFFVWIAAQGRIARGN